jgi:lipopolysaccharide transport system permease protein
MELFKYRIRTFAKYSDLIKELIRRDLKLKYRRSFLGYVWSVLNPLLIMIVMTVVFSTMFKKNIENYPVYLLTGRVLYDFLKTSTTQGMKSVHGNASLLKKVYVPKYIFTFCKISSCLVDSLLSLGALFIVMLATKAPFYWQIVLIPVVFVQIYIFCLGLGFFLAQLNVFFKDVQYIYSAVTTAWLYLTPIIYPFDRLKNLPTLQYVISHFNPLYYYVSQMRSFVYLGEMPSARMFFGGWIFALVMLVIGVYFFQRSKDKFILYI